MSLEPVLRDPAPWDTADELLDKLARQTDEAASTADRQLQAQQLLELVQASERRRSAVLGWTRRLLLFAGVLVAAYAGARSVSDPSHERGVFGASGVWLATRDAPTEQRLSKGVDVHLEPWTRLRTLARNAGPIWLSLEAGTVRARFHEAGERAFRFDAGPYALRGNDGVLAVSWEPHTRTFAVRVERGEVEVRRLEDEPRVLTAGESLGGSELEQPPLPDVAVERTSPRKTHSSLR